MLPFEHCESKRHATCEMLHITCPANPSCGGPSVLHAALVEQVGAGASCFAHLVCGGVGQAWSCMAHRSFVAQRKPKRPAGKMSSDSVVGGGSESPPGDGQCSALVPRAPRKGRCQRTGLRVYLIVATECFGFWHGLWKKKDSSSSVPQKKSEVVALVLGKVVASPLGSNASSEVQQRLRDGAMTESRRAITQGFLEYEGLMLFQLNPGFSVKGMGPAAGALMESVAGCGGVLTSFANPGAEPRQSQAGQVVQEWQAEHGPLLAPAVARLDRRLAEKFVTGGGKHFHCISLAAKINRKRLLAEDDVPRKALKRMRLDLPPAPSAPPLCRRSAGAAAEGSCTTRRWP